METTLVVLVIQKEMTLETTTLVKITLETTATLVVVHLQEVQEEVLQNQKKKNL